MTREEKLLEALAAVGIQLHKTKIEEQMQILINELTSYNDLLSRILKRVNEDDAHKESAHKYPHRAS
jgi:hypothetical protein